MSNSFDYSYKLGGFHEFQKQSLGHQSPERSRKIVKRKEIIVQRQIKKTSKKQKKRLNISVLNRWWSKKANVSNIEVAREDRRRLRRLSPGETGMS